MELESYRNTFAPIVFGCLEELLKKIQKNNDSVSYAHWVTLVESVNASVVDAFRTFIDKTTRSDYSQEYFISIQCMFMKYETNSMMYNSV